MRTSISKQANKPLSTLTHITKRYAHWFHDFRSVGGVRDQHEVFHKDYEFGQEAITDKDRYPHLYWSIYKGRTVMSRVVDQWGYSKDLKPEKILRDVERMVYFQKLDSLNFLEVNRGYYQYLDNDAKGAIGYITGDDNLSMSLTDDKEYGVLYKDASDEYRSRVLEDECDGRPCYEWQVPYGLDEAYGYKDVSTAVDILGNNYSNNNLPSGWEQVSSSHGCIKLQNKKLNSNITIVNEDEAASYIKNTEPDTVIFQRGAELLLTQLRSFISPTCWTDINGCAISLAWTGFIYCVLWPSSPFLSTLMGLTLFSANSLFIYNTILSNQNLKSAFKECRNLKCDVVLGDWLCDDYDERIHQVKLFDDVSNGNNTENILTKFLPSDDNNSSNGMLNTLYNNVIERSNIHSSNNSEINTYTDAINDRRIDLLTHVAHNIESENILLCVRRIDNISSENVANLICDRLRGNINIESSPLQFDRFYERVHVAI